METISAKKREITGMKVEQLREKGLLPAVLYGPNHKNLPIELDFKEFNQTFKKAGQSSLITLQVEGDKVPVLIHDYQRDPLSEDITHVDFYAPNMTEETEVTVPLIFIGEASAVKDLKGTLVKNISEIEVKCLPQDIPHSVEVDISALLDFESRILIKDIKLSAKVHALRGEDDIVALVAAPQDVEAQLAETIEENVESVEKIEKEKKVEVPEGEAQKESKE